MCNGKSSKIFMHMIELVSGANHCIRQRHERKANWTPNYPSVDEVEWFICIFRLEMLMTRIIYAFSLSCGGLDCVWKKEFHDHFYAARQNPRVGREKCFSRENCKQINWHSLRHLLSELSRVLRCAKAENHAKDSRSSESFPSASEKILFKIFEAWRKCEN